MATDGTDEAREWGRQVARETITEMAPVIGSMIRLTAEVMIAAGADPERALAVVEAVATPEIRSESIFDTPTMIEQAIREAVANLARMRGE